MKVGFIGTGNMGGALAHAAAQSPAPAELLLSNRTPEKAQALAQQLGNSPKSFAAAFAFFPVKASVAARPSSVPSISFILEAEPPAFS